MLHAPYSERCHAYNYSAINPFPFVPTCFDNRTAQRPLLFMKVELGERMPKKLPKGNYEFPFSFDVPVTMPSSVRIKKGSISWAQVRYTIRALFIGSGPGRTVVSERTLSVISAPRPPDPVPFMVDPNTSVVKNAIGVSKGSITFGVYLENTRVGRSEELKIAVACRNDTTIDIERVQVKLNEICEWKINGQHESLVQTLATIPKVFVGDELDRRPKKDIKDIEKSGIKTQQAYLDIFSDITSRKNVAVLKVPEVSQNYFETSVFPCVNKNMHVIVYIYNAYLR